MKSEYQIIEKHKYSKQVGEKIKYLRKLNKISQESLANKVGLTRTAVTLWESKLDHQRTVPSLDKLNLLANIFNVDVDYFQKDIGDDVEYLKLSTAISKESLSVLDFLDSVPHDAIHIYEHNKLCKQEIKYGVICKQAAIEIRKLKQEIDNLKNDQRREEILVESG
jgi:transcriptional regulator with XRE-family HTH domain